MASHNNIHLDGQGEGPAVVLLHGWGLHGGVWGSAAAILARDHRVIRVDMPGFGASPPLAVPYTAQALADAVAEAVPEQAVWIGWSLGGLVALAAAVRGAAMEKLVLVGTTPRFVQGSDWPHAMAPELLANFAIELEHDYRGTVLRFLALQARGSEQARDEGRGLRKTVFAHGEPSLPALRGGLEVLRGTDLRSALPALRPPVLVIHGERDMLVPMAAAQATASALGEARLVRISDAGHAPFLSHPDLFAETVSSFLHE